MRSRFAWLCFFVALTTFLAPPAFAEEPGNEEKKPEAKKPDPKAAAAASGEAEEARKAGRFEVCIEKDKAAIEAEANTARRVHLAGCADKANKVLDALAQLHLVLEEALAAKNSEVADLVSKRVEQLLKRLGSMTVTAPADAKDLWVEVDGVVVTEEQLNKPLAIDPGNHRITAHGLIGGTNEGTFEGVESVKDGERVTVAIMLTPKAAEHLTQGQLECLHSAKNDAEAFRCLPGKSKALVARVALEMSSYIDSLSVRILNPMIRANVASPTKGWAFGASYLVDVISAASPDFVSTASPRGHDTRHAVNATASYKPSRFGADVAGGYSTEADYISRFAGLGVIGDFFEKRFTPRLGWTVSYDTISRGGTPIDVFANTLWTNEGALSLSFVMTPKTVLVLGGTMGIERGDQSKPYRLIPMFASGVEVPAGASPATVNQARLPVRPYEQLPKERDRIAAGARLTRRIGPTTLRLEERLYTDTWANKATTTDVRWLIDLSSKLTLGPHFRYHRQSGASFFHRIYNATVEPNVTVPTFRTTDRELGPFQAVTAGASTWWRISKEDASLGWMLYASGDGLFGFYRDSLYLKSRQAAYGTVGIEAVFE